MTFGRGRRFAAAVSVVAAAAVFAASVSGQTASKAKTAPRRPMAKTAAKKRPALPPAPKGPVHEVFRSATGEAAVEMMSAALRPGEAVLFVFAGGGSVRSAEVTFLDRTVRLGSGDDAAPALGFDGIDVGRKPGRYPVAVKFTRADGATEDVAAEVTVGGRTFPESKITVPQQYVTPPAEVLERIRLEGEKVARAYRQVSPGWLGTGAFDRPHAGTIAPNFGERRVNNGQLRSTHTGVDVRAGMGDPIHASNGGRVVLADELYMSGNTVIIDHGLGVFTTYMHMSKLLVSEDQRVAKGDVVGLCGSTGRSTGPHLHWSARVYDSRVDPMSLLALPLK